MVYMLPRYHWWAVSLIFESSISLIVIACSTASVVFFGILLLLLEISQGFMHKLLHEKGRPETLTSRKQEECNMFPPPIMAYRCLRRIPHLSVDFNGKLVFHQYYNVLNLCEDRQWLYCPHGRVMDRREGTDMVDLINLMSWRPWMNFGYFRTLSLRYNIVSFSKNRYNTVMATVWEI